MLNCSRRHFMVKISQSVFVFSTCNLASNCSKLGHNDKPNIILCMSDDQGWGDTGYNGHPIIKTPGLDEMAANGIQFNRFYSAAPVCSPTRGSCLTSRHPFRYGISYANVGHMKKQEITLAEALKMQGYTTGHFGKWHLGTLTKTEKDSNRGGPDGAKHYSPPWENGFDVCFSTEAKVPTWNPMIKPVMREGNVESIVSSQPYGTYYWNENGKKVTENLEGDDSRIIMDRVIPFIQRAVSMRQSFFAVIWFHAPHLPVIAGSEYRGLYENRSIHEQHFYGCITAMDEQIGRLRKMLRESDIAENTMFWFCSDNGPEGKTREGPTQGSTNGLRGRKRSLFEGGVRVPGLLEWPAKIKKHRKVDIPCCTSDYYPTIMDILGFKIPSQPVPVDGISLLPLIEKKLQSRPKPIAFESDNQISLIDNQYKLISQNGGQDYMLFDLIDDQGENCDLSRDKPEIAGAMRKTLEEWRSSCNKSLEGNDYL